MKSKITKQQEKEICKLYKKSKHITLKQIAKIYHVCDATIMHILNKNGINTSLLDKYSVDENYFDKIDTEEKAYFLGLLYSDGSNDYPTANRIQLSFEVQDEYMLKRFRKAIKSNRPLRNRKARKGIYYDSNGNKKFSHSKPQKVLAISNKKIPKVLSDMGMVKNKTKILRFPSFLPKNLIRHFIRGYFDGDGTNYPRKSFIKNNKDLSGMRCNIVTASKEFAKVFINIIENYCPSIKVCICKPKNEECYKINFDGVDAFKFMDWMYCGRIGVNVKIHSIIFLKRKFANYLKTKKLYLLRSGGKYLKRNGVKGSSNNKAKLTETQVIKIFNDKRKTKVIANKYNVNKATICSIKSGKTWKHLNLLKNKEQL